jgi:hypothetical protein
VRLTIIPVDKNVGIDDVNYLGLDLSTCAIPSDVHALQWLDTAGWIEFVGGVPNEDITVLPDWANCCIGLWQTADYDAHHPADPLPPTAEENKQTASGLLYDTDWTTIPDVSDPTRSNPYLSNVQDFVTYRNAVRQYAVYPVAGFIDWPIVPTAVWTNV